jgi:hypothetical protein
MSEAFSKDFGYNDFVSIKKRPVNDPSDPK